MSVDYLLYSKDKIGKQVGYHGYERNIEGYLIDNNRFWNEQYDCMEVPIKTGYVNDEGILIPYENSKESVKQDMRCIKYWREHGLDFIKNIPKESLRDNEAMYNTYDELIEMIPKLLDWYEQGYIFELSV
jgi:hypothetical protein